MKLTARDMQQRVEIHNPPAQADRDEFGQEVRRFENVATVWAKVEPLAGREFFAAQQQQSPASMRVRIFWRDDVTDRTRIVWRGKAFDLVADPIEVDAARNELTLMVASASDA